MSFKLHVLNVFSVILYLSKLFVIQLCIRICHHVQLLGMKKISFKIRMLVKQCKSENCILLGFVKFIFLENVLVIL